MTDLFRKDPQNLGCLYQQLAAQVKSYHRHYRMGDNTSVSSDTARELLESMAYTLARSPDGTLETGQVLLEAQLAQAKRRHSLVLATAPDWDSQYRFDTVQALGNYLHTYDPRHFAHRIPEDPAYPLLVFPPETMQGLDVAMFWLNCLWYENQLLEAMGTAARGCWEESIPDYWGIPLNLCEQPLIQLLGRQLLGLALSESELTEADRAHLAVLLRNFSKEDLLIQAKTLLERLSLPDPQAAAYGLKFVDSLFPRLRAALPFGDLSRIFL